MKGLNMWLRQDPLVYLQAMLAQARPLLFGSSAKNLIVVSNAFLQ